MSEFLAGALRFFTSFRLTVVLLVFSIILVFIATLDQVNLGIWAVQEKYFRSFFVFWQIPDSHIAIPLFPGGYLIGALLLLNLVGAHIQRFRLTWRKTGLFLTHAGLILLLVGELLSGLWQEDYTMHLSRAVPTSFSESQKENELAIIDTTDPREDAVLSIPEEVLANERHIQHPKLPFRIQIKAYYPNSRLQMKQEGAGAPESQASAGTGRQIVAVPLGKSFRHDQRNTPSAVVELVGTEGSLGTFLLSTGLEAPESLTVGGRSFAMIMRPLRIYHPFTITLTDLRHDVYPGSDIPRNFSSRIRLKSGDGKDDRDILIFMNNPLRHAGFTFYQYQMNQASDFSVLQVVRNPSWMIPYVSCIMLSAGLFLHFSISLGEFIKRRREPKSTGASS